MKDRVSSLKLFSRVARTGSFTMAGKDMGLSQPSVSRIISSLEKDLGASLLVRNTHAMKLTEAGAAYLARIEPILSALEEANHMVRGDGKLQGRLRIGVAISFAMREIIPRLPDFVAEHPDLRIDLVPADFRQDLVDQTAAIDVVIRFGELGDSTLTARPLGQTPRLVAAAPAYLKKAGTPKTPADLAAHQIFLGPSGQNASGWTFKKNGQTSSVRIKSHLTMTVNEASTTAAVAGMGIIFTGLWGCKKEVASGELVQILPEWDVGHAAVHVVLAGGKMAKPSARAFAAYLVESFRKNP